MTRCDFCGGTGHDWSVHPEAVADAAAWQRAEQAAHESDEWMVYAEMEMI